MTYNRLAVENYARRHWNRPCDDGKIETKLGPVLVSQKARQFGATGPDWEAEFVSAPNGAADETLCFINNNAKDQKIETDLHSRHFEDCTHYLSRCLIHGGISVPQTAWAPTMVANLQNRTDTKTLIERVPLAQASIVMETGMMKPGDVIAYWLTGLYHHMAVRVEADGISCHTRSRYNRLPGGDTWDLYGVYLYTFIHFSADDPVPSNQLLLANGWWAAETPSARRFYYIFSDGRVRSSDHKPVSSGSLSFDPKHSGYWFDTDGTLLIIWRANGWVEEYKFDFVTSSYDGTRYCDELQDELSLKRLG